MFKMIQAMIDTGANVSLIDKVELDRIQSENKVSTGWQLIKKLSYSSVL